MRFVNLIVEAFQGVERAELELGPGLNILYGPNDLGKSTLASAIRAALLIPSGSSAAEDFAPWYADARPRVTLTFVADAERYWQVKKAFGSGAGASAELSCSKDGKLFNRECTARAVDEKVRALLSWGIPAPASKGGPRGLPESFLANTLLGAQTDVDAILEASLEADIDDSGKVRLQKALATLAQDPLFKRVLDAAQSECEQYFTATGKVRRHQGSALVAADEAVKRHQRELNELKQTLDESLDIEGQVRVCREARDNASLRVSEAQMACDVARLGFANARARADAEQRLVTAKQELDDIEQHATYVGKLKLAQDALAADVREQEQVVALARTESEIAEMGVRAAEEARRLALSEAGERERQLRTAELNAMAAKLSTRRMEVHARREKAISARTVVAEAKKAADDVDEARLKQSKCGEVIAEARTAVERADEHHELARAALAYGRWRAATVAAREAAEANEKAAEARVAADKKSAEANDLESRAALTEVAVAERRALLPSIERLRELEELGRQCELAEAALGGGLSIAVRPRKAIRVVAAIDHTEPIQEPSLSIERVFEAERELHLSIDDLVDIDVTAGAADKRRAVEELRARWKSECSPVLEQAGVRLLADIAGAHAAIQSEEGAARELRNSAARLREESGALRERADLIQQQATKGTIEPEELAAKRGLIGSVAHEVLDANLARLGRNWESQAEVALEQRAKERASAQGHRAQVERDADAAGFKVTEAEKRLNDVGGQVEVALAALDGQVPDVLVAKLDEELAGIAAEEAGVLSAMSALDSEASSTRATVDRDLAEAAEKNAKSSADCVAAQEKLDTAKAALNTKRGERAAQEEALGRMNRAAALADVQKRQAELDALPAAPLGTEAGEQAAEAALTHAEQDLVDKSEAFHKADGALSRVGGAQLRERVEGVEEALEVARAHERQLTVDANAWKLLRDTLRDAENAEGAHLGRALSGPVGERFAELTKGRYGNLRFDPFLRAENVEAIGAAPDNDVLKVLSVGTRDQLATLVRLTIATQLRCAIILDDHLVHTDPERLAWFRSVLVKTAVETQVIVFTCRPEDYLETEEVPTASPMRDLAGGNLRAIDLERVVRRWGAEAKKAVEGAA